MTSSVLSVVPLILGLFAWQPGDVPGSVTRLVIQDEVILRVPVQARPISPNVEWREKKGPKCIPASLIRRASLSGPEQVDFILSGGSRVRAQFQDNCPALGFYGGFYLQFGRDQQICAKRDAVQSRMGRNCTIGRFRLLIPKFKH